MRKAQISRVTGETDITVGINQQDDYYYPQVAVIPPKCQQPGSQQDASSGNRDRKSVV